MSPTETSKPIGAAIPTPVEPGLDQPLPEKGQPPAKDDQSPRDAAHPGGGESDPSKGIPASGPSDAALRERIRPAGSGIWASKR
ncbi:hypothetical protein [Paraburkholderia humisilvae]|nr:hypothetical protein [Paraburkholderia humisilvae]